MDLEGSFKSPKPEQLCGAGPKILGVSMGPASRCKNESNARVADVMRKVEMQKKKGGIKWDLIIGYHWIMILSL